MVNKNLFNTGHGENIANTMNAAGGRAFAFSPEHALAQISMTGCLNSTYYVDAQHQLTDLLNFAQKCDLRYCGQTAVLAREKGYMKDLPALLTVYIAAQAGRAFQSLNLAQVAWKKCRNDASSSKVDQAQFSNAVVVAEENANACFSLFRKVFARVINNGKMLRNFAQITRAGVTGRKSFGSAIRNQLRGWFSIKTPEDLFRMSVGNDPSFADIVKMIHPRPENLTKSALYAYFIGKDHNPDDLPMLVRHYNAFKAGQTPDVPAVPFEMLTALPLTDDQWKGIAQNASWQWTRMNLNTLLRHNVFKDINMVQMVAKRLKDRDLIANARAFPYQLMSAWLNVDAEVPTEIRSALAEAMEISTKNVLPLDAAVRVLVDTSGSMANPITGYRKGSTSKMRCVDVAGLIASVYLRRNENCECFPFDTKVHPVKLSSSATIMDNARKLARNGGGTNCSCALRYLNEQGDHADIVIYVSDNESWVDSGRNYGYDKSTGTLKEWESYKRRNPLAKLVCIDLTPNTSSQAKERQDILNVGSFSDHVFDVVHMFRHNELDPEHWVSLIKSVEL